VDVIEFIEIARVMGVDPGQLFSKIVEWPRPVTV